MNAQERQIDCVISTEKDLEELVRQALITGVLDLENCQVKVEFNLTEILKCLHPEALVRNENKNGIFPIFTIDCPFEIKAKNATFSKQVSMITSHQIPSIGSVGCLLCLKKLCDFRKAKFEENTDFSFVQFETDKTEDEFNRTSYNYGFSSSEFKKDVSFYNIYTKWNLNFEKVIFHGSANFYSSTFKSPIFFCWTTFKSEVNFEYIECHSQFYFKGNELHNRVAILPASLQDNIDILAPKFEGEKSKLEVNLLKCNEDSEGSITFDDLKMDQDRIYITVRNLKEDVENVEIKFKTCNFYGKNISFKKVNNIDAVNFDDVDDISGFDFDLLKPTVLKRTIHMLWTFPFNRYQFQAIHKNTDEALKKVDMWASIYANLKAKADEKGERQLGNDYFFWQQYFQGKSPLKSTKHWVNSFYMNTSVYGLSYILPLAYFILVFFFGGIFYNLLGDEFATISITSVQKSFCSQIMVYLFEMKGYIVSISASLPFVFSDSKLVESLLPELPENAKRLKTGLFYGLYILQHLIQGYLLFQIGAAIRNKVKR